MIPFSNPKAQYLAMQAELDAAVNKALHSGQYILGGEVTAFEQEFAAYLGTKFCTGVANGTEALQLTLMALGLGPGDEVITVSHTATATVAAMVAAGVTPVFADIDPRTYNIDPDQVEKLITTHTRAIVPVHLYGHPADMARLQGIAEQHGLLLIEDCAQATGAEIAGRKTGSFGQAACFSFYPTKNLGALGDGGAVVTSDEDLNKELRLLRQYGWEQRYSSSKHGLNSRLDEIQAAILRVKLAHLDKLNDLRRELAAKYGATLSGPALPTEQQGARHVYHLYVVRCEQRDSLLDFLLENGVGAAIHYPVPVHRQPAYANDSVTLPMTEQAASEILSLPMYPELGGDIDRVIAAVNKFYSDAQH